MTATAKFLAALLAGGLLALPAMAGEPRARDAGPSGPRTAPLAAPLAAIPEPVALSSFAARDHVGKGKLRFEVRRKAGEVRVTESTGCRWQRSEDWFAPSHAWTGCGTSRTWKAGTAQVRVIDPLWPLKPGARGVYEREAVSHTGERYTRRTTCKVGEPVAVLGPEGASVPAHVVTCDDGKRMRRTWYAPGIGPVAFVQRHHEKGVEEAWTRLP